MCFEYAGGDRLAPTGSAIRAETAEEESSGERQPRYGGKVTSSRSHTRPELEGSHLTRVGFFTSGFSSGHGRTSVRVVETLKVSFLSFPSPRLLPFLYSRHFPRGEGIHSAAKVLPPLGEHLTPPLPHLDFTAAIQPHRHLLLPGGGIKERPPMAATQA